VRASRVRTMDEHFAELFERYGQIAPTPAFRPAAAPVLLPEMAFARSAAPVR
jgi:hypothetical protein